MRDYETERMFIKHGIKGKRWRNVISTDLNTDDNELTHYGIPNMKWDPRKRIHTDDYYLEKKTRKKKGKNTDAPTATLYKSKVSDKIKSNKTPKLTKNTTGKPSTTSRISSKNALTKSPTKTVDIYALRRAQMNQKAQAAREATLANALAKKTSSKIAKKKESATQLRKNIESKVAETKAKKAAKLPTYIANKKTQVIQGVAKKKNTSKKLKNYVDKNKAKIAYSRLIINPNNTLKKPNKLNTYINNNKNAAYDNANAIPGILDIVNVVNKKRKSKKTNRKKEGG